MSPDPIQLSGSEIDLSKRFAISTAVVASPALAAETIIAQVAISADPAVITGVLLDGWAAFTVGTAGTAVRLRLRQTNVAGLVVGDTGALTGGVAAAALIAQDVSGFDVAAVRAQVYVLTLQVTAGAAISTVSAVRLVATVL